ncbi:hypothetical protein Tco_0145589 [Tanacetum coccineum]
MISGMTGNEECFWGQIHDDFNKSTNGVSRTHRIYNGKWEMEWMLHDVKSFTVFTNGITGKSDEIDGDVLKLRRRGSGSGVYEGRFKEELRQKIRRFKSE